MSTSEETIESGAGRAEPPETRQRLLEAAIRSLQEKGYARTTTRGIVALAGAHLPAVNYYFGSKDQLLQEAVVEAIRRWGQTTMRAAAAAEGDDPAAQLHVSLERFIATLDQDRPYVVAAIEAFAQAERSEELRERLADAYEEFREVVALSVTRSTAGAGTSPPEEAVAAISSTLIALFDGLAIQHLIDPDRAASAEQVLTALAGLSTLVAGRDGEVPG